MPESKSAKEVDALRVKFSKDLLTYLENRINMLDNKASILIAIQGGLGALITWVTKEVFWTDTLPMIKSVSYIILAVDFSIMFLTILLLTQVIRPSKKFFGLRVPLDKMKVEGYVMWPDDGFPKSEEDFRIKIASLDSSKIQENYNKANYTALQLVRLKYGYYRYAASCLKIMIALSALGLFILALLKICKS